MSPSAIFEPRANGAVGGILTTVTHAEPQPSGTQGSAPSTSVEPQPNGTQSGTVLVAVLVSVGAAIVISLLVIMILFLRRRKRNKANTSYIHTVAPLRIHKPTLSDASGKPLLMEESNDDWDFRDNGRPPTRRYTDDDTREDREVLSNNPNGLYHLPSFHTRTPVSPAPSSGCLTHGFDTLPLAPKSLPPLPLLPNTRQPHSGSRHTVPAGEELSPLQPPSSSVSTASLYSQPATESPPGSPGSYFSPLSQELAHAQDAPPDEDGLRRADTHFVGALLKNRAQRNGDGLVRGGSQVSQIERSGSIKSVASIHHDNRPYAKRYRAKKRKAPNQEGEMEVVEEASEGRSIRSRPVSSPTAHWDPSLLLKIPPRAAGGPVLPSLRRA